MTGPMVGAATAPGQPDPALAAVVGELESHAAAGGWDQPARLYALVETAELAASEPALAAALGPADVQPGALTPIEQDGLPVGQELEEALTGISWPPAVTGCAAVVERLVLPPDADAELPEDAGAARAYAHAHPDRQEVRVVAAATRTGATYCALRMRAHDDERSVIGGVDLVPQLLALLQTTLEDDDT